jgi:hypothetical protein
LRPDYQPKVRGQAKLQRRAFFIKAFEFEFAKRTNRHQFSQLVMPLRSARTARPVIWPVFRSKRSNSLRFPLSLLRPSIPPRPIATALKMDNEAKSRPFFLLQLLSAEITATISPQVHVEIEKLANKAGA